MTRRGFVALVAAGRYESIARLAARELPAGVEYILLRDVSAIASRWGDAAVAAPLGSLVKPFLALAYGEGNGFRYPVFECTGCWLPRGHGRIGITQAIAQSCNGYFVQLARAVASGDVERVAARYGLGAPEDRSPESLIGRYGNWRAQPAVAAMAYRELAQRRSEGGVALVFDALRLCARSGTASGIGCAVAAKTGTAPCVHSRGAPGDGLTAALFPESSPEFVLLARAHGVPGAECARRAGAFVRAVLK
jgi:cell division protein FtsI/penicillin-binding protein 2